MSEQVDDRNQVAPANVRAHLANERTYLAWLRTGIATIGLGFIVAKFGLSANTLYFSTVTGIFIVVVGGFIELVALRRFVKTQQRIKLGNYEPTTGTEILLSSSIFVIALLLITYLFLTL